MPSYKLTESDVQNIRQLLDAGMMLKVIAAKFDVSPWTIGEIRRGKAWKDARGQKLNAQRVENIRTQLAAGINQRYLALLYGVSQPVISQIHRGEIWKN